MEKQIIDITPTSNAIVGRKRVAAYARVSSDKDTMLHSLAAQIDYYRKYIVRHPEWELVGMYADEAKTGTKDDRRSAKFCDRRWEKLRQAKGKKLRQVKGKKLRQAVGHRAYPAKGPGGTARCALAHAVQSA